MSDENTCAVRVFSREHATLGGAEYRSATPPSAGDVIAVRVVHGSATGYGATTREARVRVISVDADRGVVEAHLL